MSSNETSEQYWERIGGTILQELERRLNSSDSASDLPGTLLMRLAEKYLAYLDKKMKDQEGDDAPYYTPMEAIDQEGLPVEAKMEILEVYIESLVEQKTVATERLEQLREENRGLPSLHEQVAP